jgi:mono/diheme cytochrome c family protein
MNRRLFARRVAVPITAFTAALLAPLLASSCGATRDDLPVETAVSRDDIAVVRGAQEFAQHCYKCHPGGEAGVGPGIIDKPLPKWLMRLQVRAGLGVMPSFPKEAINDQELDELLAYLKALRQSR